MCVWLTIAPSLSSARWWRSTYQCWWWSRHTHSPFRCCARRRALPPSIRRANCSVGKWIENFDIRFRTTALNTQVNAISPHDWLQGTDLCHLWLDTNSRWPIVSNCNWIYLSINTNKLFASENGFQRDPPALQTTVTTSYHVGATSWAYVACE